MKTIRCPMNCPHSRHRWEAGPTWEALECPGRKTWRKGTKPKKKEAA